MAAEERSHLSYESENSLNKFYEDEAYKSRHYKKRLLLGYTQCDLNNTAHDAHEKKALGYNEPNFKLVDLTRFKADPYHHYFKNSNNLFIRRSEKRKLVNCDLNVEETLSNHQYKVIRIEGELQCGAEGISGDFHTSLEGANCSTIEIRHFGHMDDEVPLNLAINKRLPAPEDTCEEPPLDAKIPSTENDGESPTLTDYTSHNITEL
ncbi:uncharacterized protein [Chelonus insularis]|uniref:uncharacterized protein n=1 Tax=Chelonus insularis TaxID=460826 RepID=UPI00158C9785|nr:uncharacterized protein LOC118065041 [Chelonus insularis]